MLTASGDMWISINEHKAVLEERVKGVDIRHLILPTDTGDHPTRDMRETNLREV